MDIDELQAISRPADCDFDITSAPIPPDDFDPDKYRQYAWCFRSRCPGGQVHQRLRCLLEASGKASHVSLTFAQNHTMSNANVMSVQVRLYPAGEG